MSDKIYLSVIAPAYNERDNIEQFVREVYSVCAGLGKPFEIIVVDDGSTDDQLEVLAPVFEEITELRVVCFAKNTGQSAGVAAGIKAARGEIIAMVDSDLQNDPASIPDMLGYIERGECDMVNGWRKERNDPPVKLLSTRIANGVRNALTHESIHDSACGLKVFRAQCVRDIRFFTGLHRFIPTLVKLEGYRVKEVPVRHRPRVAGESKYGVGNRAFRALRDTFAIRWMQSRYFKYEATEWSRDESNIQ
ncbi:MAG: glycosyltransferase family 2 protein [Phycisphaerae bacterium]